MDKAPLIRRSAGMRGDPRNAAPEHRPISDAYKAMPEDAVATPVSKSRYAKPRVLMGEVIGPKAADCGVEIEQQRLAFRAFMRTHRLIPSQWAKAAGVPMGEVLAYLAGRARELAPQTLARLAQAAKVTPDDLFRA